MACIKTTPLKSNASHRLMRELGYVNRPSVSDKSVWSDYNNSDLEFQLDPNQLIPSARQVVRMSFAIGLKQGAMIERARIKAQATEIATNLIDSFITS